MTMYPHPQVLGELRTRDWIAVMAMQGMLTNPEFSKDPSLSIESESRRAIAELAYEVADAMIEASAKGESH